MMDARLRRTGIGVVDGLPWGTHLCQFYETKQDLLDVLVPYFKAGLENNELCLWITSGPLEKSEAHEAMMEAVPHFDSYLRSEQMETIPYTDYYLQNGSFSQQKVLGVATSRITAMAEKGYSGLRASGNVGWLQKQGWKDFTRFEEVVDSLIGENQMMAICSYPLAMCGVQESLDVMKNHRLALIKQQGAWQVIENLGQTRTEAALRQTEEKYRHLFESTQDGVEVIDGGTGRIVLANQAAARMFGFDNPEDMVGVDPLDYIPPEDRERVASMISEYMFERDLHKVIELRALKKDGTSIWLSAIGVKTEYEGRLAGLVSLRDVTEHRQAEQAFRDSERRYRLLAENVSDVLFISDMNLRLSYISPSITRLLGFTLEEAESRSIHEALTPESQSLAMKAVDELLEADRRGTELCVSNVGELEMIRKDGSTVWTEADVSLLRDPDGHPNGFVGIIRDISKRKTAETSLRESEEKYRTLVESSPDGIIAGNSEGRIVDCNTSVCNLLGYTKEELKGAHVQQVATAKAVQAGQSFMKHVGRRGYGEAEVEMVHHDGHKIPVWARMVDLRGTKQSDFQVLTYLRDMEERKKVDELKDQFIGLVSHELRTPLTVIIGSVSTVLSEGARLPHGESRRLLEDASSEADLLSHILDNLLELSRSQAQRLTLQLEPIVLEEVVRKTIDKVGRYSSAHQFVIDLPGMLPPIHADRIRLERILYNLLENAVKYSSGGEIRVSAGKKARNLVVEVHDQGPGISTEDQARLFQPFQRTKRGDRDGIQGIGLGLLVCRSLVEAHGGKIWLESSPGQGTSFFFTLPSMAGPRRGTRRGT